MIPVAITGAAGRMGQRLVALAKQSGRFEVVGAVERPGHEALGRDAGEVAGIGPIGVPVTADLRATPRVLVDFTAPASMRQWLASCRGRGVAMVIGTTGLQPADQAAIDAAAANVAVLQAPNMSLGVNLLFRVAAEVAKRLGDEYDVEVVEGHHRFKKDAPSGTAMGLADAILAATGKTRDALVYDRHGDDCPRKPGEVGMHALRIGDEVGRHTAYFAALGERLELTHVATNRDTFVHGALRAAAWLAGRPPGRYSMADVLGL
ncbi:MAG: 4-hydroxy-tetrahydrodipicolinate reductase [uncultured Phycisphaerae bacterium]|uniref:4-hydroxy-tetrahydrodipicolinate reductase n=1 Tax=uncultured Phycisphaerae bacterium TaxID=904963 RepID=A0A6J4N528_9BACT|nr:MAG: 4-hydroxy-tetrahydrodipicolinate reductase [uncultured Phycisphaerae bacterium]